METKNRIKYIDTAKGLGMLCVIIAHMGWPLADRIILPFCMPLFFLLSGYFISEKYQLTEFVKLKARQLLLPYCWTCIGGCFLAVIANVFLGKLGMERPGLLQHWILASLYGSCLDYSEPFAIYGVGALWFLLALFFALTLVYLLRNVTQGYLLIIFLAIISVISSQYMWLPFSIQAGGLAAFFVYMGYQLKKKNLLNTWNGKLALLGLLVWIAEIISNVRVDISRNIVDAWGITAVGAIFICYFILYMSSKLRPNNFVARSMDFLGQNSMLILCFHGLEIKFFPWSLVYSIFSFSHDIADIVVLIVRIAFCVICTILFKRIMGMCRKTEKNQR